MEEDFFIKKMKGVKPINNNEESLKKNKNIKNNIIKEKTYSKLNIPNQTLEKTKSIKSEFNLSFGDINKDLKKGRVKIDRRLDLHGYSLIEAQTRFEEEVVKLYNNNKRCLLVITGKGSHLKKNDSFNDTKDTPKLFYGKIKNAINSWITSNNLKKYILTYQNAGFEHGGEGAIFVYLRKKPNA